jgi:hypothetical protein
VQRIAVRCRRQDGTFAYGVLICSLSAEQVLTVLGRSRELAGDPVAVLLAYVTFYDLLGAGLLVFLLALILGVLNILLGVQMVVRMALILVLIVLAGPALVCFALPQTLSYGRMGLSLFSTTVMVQFFQVVTLALGGVLVTSLGAANLFNLDSTLATLLISLAVLYLVLRIPSIVHRFALRPMTDASTAVARSAQGTADYAASVAPRLLALL